jgi:signal transduction histidine kinase
MGPYSLSLLDTIIAACALIGSLLLYSVITRVRNHRQYFGALRRQSLQLATLQEEERTRLAYDLHDELGPLLATIRLQLRKGRRQMDADKLTEAEDNLVRATHQLRSILRNLVPRDLAEKGLRAVLEELFAQYQALYPTSIHFYYMVNKPLRPEMAVHLYRIVQESVQNSLTHSGAAAIQVVFRQDKRHLYVICRDNGSGLFKERPGGLGVSSLRLRSLSLNGEFSYQSEPGKGTTHYFIIPLNHLYGNDNYHDC